MKLDKRGQGLSMNMVVVAILAILILVVVAIVFTGGVSNAVQRMKQFLNIGTAGQDIEFAREQCRIECENAKVSDNPSKSRYCTVNLPIRDDAGNVKSWKCRESPIDYSCSGVDVNCV